MPRKIALRENGVKILTLTVPDEATDAQIKSAMARAKAAVEAKRAAGPPPANLTDPLDEEIRCIVCVGRVIVKRRELEAHMTGHRQELEQLRTTRGHQPVA